ncbi:hypothetical protein [Methanoregula sp.]|uniref:hypothetical protein n=1 Tax=Methanoregula sp. TaxID=2052170 RepID=UPI002C402F87|nr:hypothetical protein [Methanoregula sp.]HVP96443.1 hypothetical protein [Methanoregula sp.]
MSRTSNEELGRRRFQLGKAHAVEEAIEKIRRGPAVNWSTLCGAECRQLRDILGELWVCIGKEKWEEYTFSTLTEQEIRDLLALGAGKEGHALTCATVEKMDAILSHRKSTSPDP